MTKQYSLRAMALAGVCLLPLAAAAQDFDLGGAGAAPAGSAKEYNNEIDVGARYQSSTSPLFGRYTGNDSKGFGSLGGFHLQTTVTPANGVPLSVEATGTDLNFQPNHEGPNNALAPESEIDVKAGQQGIWGAHAYYDAITYNGQTFYTPYAASGVLASGVPTGTLTTAAGITRFQNSLLQETAGTRRDIGGADGKYMIGDWTITSGLRHEHKEGTVVQTADTAVSGGAFAEPVNYDTDRYSVLGQYATRRLQAQLGYDYSKFTDNNNFFNLPYIGSASTTAIGQYSLPPSSDAHYVTGRLGYNITPTTRLNTNFRYGMEMSQDDLGNGTSTPTVASQNNMTVGLMARTYDGTVQVVSRPISPLDLKASYGISGRDTANSPTTFLGTVNAAAADTAANAQRYTVLGQSWTKQKALLEAGYRILPSTKLTLGYAYDTVARDAGDAVTGETSDQVGYWVGHSNENTLSAKLTNNSIPNVNTSLSYEHAVRTGTFEFVGAEAESGAFYQAPRTADRIKARADYSPNDQWSIGANGKFETNHYHYAEGMTGTERDANASIGPDVSYSPTKAISAHLFYNYEQIYYANMGNGVASTLNGGYGYSASTTDSVHTVGLSGDWKVTDRLKIGADYTFSYGDVGYNMYDGIAVSPATTSYNQANVSLPSITSSMHSVKLHGEYQLADNISLLAGYGFDLYKDNDWSYGWNPVVLSSATSINTLTSGESANGYRVHSVYTAIKFKF
jgi:MtrB/PioB family decaheme-associated outer membrane protein